MKNIPEVNGTSTNNTYSDLAQGLSNLKVSTAAVLTCTFCLGMESKFAQLIKGIFVILLLKPLAEITRFNIFTPVMEIVLNCGPVVGFIIFQPELRNALQFLGRKLHFKKRRKVNAQLLLSVEKALRYLSKQKIGALITIERLMNLQDFIESGINLDADLTGELLMNIFVPNTALHDGAVIIRRGKIAAASTYLPLSHRTLPTKFGTRHRAALGMSEVSDSVTLVVSEETGEISVAYDSSLRTDLTVDQCLHIVRCEMSWM